MRRNVLIVGGGTAGWMTAAYLRVAFGEQVRVTLVESRNVPTIGVGEATFSTVRHYFDYLGLAEHEWMPECHATYKLGIRYENWRAPDRYFYHPFERLRVVDGFTLTDWWLHEPNSRSFDQDCFLIAALCDNHRSPRFLDGTLFERGFPGRSTHRTTLSEQDTQFPYAYHFDAALLARYLSGYATRRGVEHVLDDVVDVAMDERGWISGVRTREHGELNADLYVDCSGFRSLLLGKAVGEPFDSWQDTLPNDSAVALRVPADVDRKLRPCTTATAMDAGWIWNIPLYGRTGTGYVYSSGYCTAEDAERTLRASVGPAADDLEAIHIKMRTGRSRRFWVNNCVAVGLAGGFVEPLESTSIFLIQHAIEQLVKHFPGDGRQDALRDSYNRACANAMDGLHEFLALHYYGAARQDNDYWRDAKHRPLPGGLAERIKTWRHRLPDQETVFPHYHGFEPYSYTAVLMGLGGIAVAPPPALRLMDDTAARKEFQLVRDQAADLVRRLPGQHEYLRTMMGPAEPMTESLAESLAGPAVGRS